MNVSPIFTNVIGNQPNKVPAYGMFIDFDKTRLEILGLTEADGYKIYKKAWKEDRKKMYVRPNSVHGDIDLVIDFSILEFFKGL